MITRLLLASLSMDAILAGVTIHQRRQALHRVAKGLGFHDAYSTTLDRIRQLGGNRSKLGMDALMWVSHCERPLQSKELCYALEVELEVEDFNIHNVPSIRTILDCTLGLVTIDENTSIVRLLHPTLQEYLRQEPALMKDRESVVKLLSEARTSKFPFLFFLLTLILSIFFMEILAHYSIPSRLLGSG